MPPAVQTSGAQNARVRIFGRGLMAGLISQHDWTSFRLGGIESWPEHLLSCVNLMLACGFPSLIFWGPDMIQFYNDSFVPLLAEKHPLALGQAAQDCWAEAWGLIEPRLNTVLNRGETVTHQRMLVPVCRQGQVQDVYWDYSYSPIFAPGGSVAGILVICQDVTRELSEEALRREYASKLTLATQAAKLGIYTWYVANDTVHWENERIYEIVGRAREEGVVNAALFTSEVIFPEYAADFQKALTHTLTTGAQFHFLCKIRHPDGNPRWVEFSGQLEHGKDGLPYRMPGTISDVTERKQAEEGLLRTEKLAAVGRLASSIAHEINNPLAAITNLLYLAGTTDDIGQVREFLNSAEQELRRVATISNQTLQFHKQSLTALPVDCDAIFDSIVYIYHGRLLNARIRVQRRKRAHATFIGFEGEIRQVLSNLVGNAIDAMSPGGGRLLLRTRDSTEWKTGRKGIMLTIADTGTGISRATLARVFEPFYTTKGSLGTGLGLWVSKDIVTRVLGALYVRSTQQRPSGTVFSMFLPANEAPNL